MRVVVLNILLLLIIFILPKIKKDAAKIINENRVYQIDHSISYRAHALDQGLYAYILIFSFDITSSQNVQLIFGMVKSQNANHYYLHDIFFFK